MRDSAITLPDIFHPNVLLRSRAFVAHATEAFFEVIIESPLKHFGHGEKISDKLLIEFI